MDRLYWTSLHYYPPTPGHNLLQLYQNTVAAQIIHSWEDKSAVLESNTTSYPLKYCLSSAKTCGNVLLLRAFYGHWVLYSQ